jgi:hypothetical protein
VAGEKEDIPSKIFKASKHARKVTLDEASYLRIFDSNGSEDWYKIKTTSTYPVPAGKETEVISGKGVKFH